MGFQRNTAVIWNADWQRLAGRARFMSASLLTVFLIAWVAWFAPYNDLLDRSGTPLGADFSMFYVAGSVIRDGQAVKLYDQAEHQRRLQALFPGLDPRFCLPYRYPPLVAALSSLPARLPYLWAFVLFCGMSLIAGCLAVWLVAQDLPIFRSLHGNWLLAATVCWPVAIETLVGGQSSLFAFLIAAATVRGLRRAQWSLAGACLALAIYKPNVLLLFGLGVVCYQPRVLRGALPTAALLAGGMAWLTPPSVLADYLATTRELATTTWSVETPPWKVHSLAPWLSGILPESYRLLCVACGALAAAATGLHWRRSPQDAGLAIALLVIINAIFNPYTPIYDLTLLLVAAYFAADHFLTTHAAPKAAGFRNECCIPEHVTDSAGVRPICIRGSDVESRFTTVPDERPGDGRIIWAYAALIAVGFGPHLSQAIAMLTGVQIFPLAMLIAMLCLAGYGWSRRRPSLADRHAELGTPGELAC